MADHVHHADRHVADGRLARVVCLLALVIAPALLLWSFRHAGFVSDDRWFSTTRLVEPGRTLLTSRWPHPFGPAFAYRPMVLFSYELTRWLTPGTPFWYHLTNFLLHGINAALLAAIVVRLSGSATAGYLAGLLFVLHPSTYENVLWIAGRTYPIEALFALLLLWWTVTRGARPAWLQHGLGLLLLAGAFCSYEMAVSVPLLVLLVSLAPGIREVPKAQAQAAQIQTAQAVRLRRVRAALLFSSPYILLLGVYLLTRWIFISPRAGDILVWKFGQNPGALLLPVQQRLLDNITLLTGRMLDIDFDGQWPHLSITWPMLPNSVLVAIALWMATRARDLRWLAWGALACASAAVLPVVTGTGYADRLTYLSVAGFAAMLAIGMHACRRYAPTLLRAAASALLVFAMIWWGWEYRVKGHEWQHAGDVADTLLDQIVALEPAPSPRASLHVLDVPARYRSAYIFITYFHHSLRTRYGRADLDVVVHEHESPQTIIDALTASGPARAPRREAVLFQWDPRAEQIHVLWRGWTTTPAP